MTLPSAATIVSYPAGALTGEARVLHTEPAGELVAVILDATPCHPVDAGWPDQGPDRARFAWSRDDGSAVSCDVADCVVAATDGSALHLGADIPVRRGTDGWVFLVAHLVPAETAPAVGDRVSVTVDPEHRTALSLGHTGCHLASLALNRAMRERWSKPVAPDALGAPNFDGQANATSRILPRGSVDTYRLNKSLRRAGFVADGLAEELHAIEDAVNAQLTEWVAADAPVRIDRDGDLLTDRRRWVCILPDGVATIECGGTHARSLGELGDLRATLTISDDGGTRVLTMVTEGAGPHS